MATSSVQPVSKPGGFEMVGFLEEANALLDKIKGTAENVTTCQNQIDQIFSRCGGLLEALLADSMTLEGSKIQAASEKIEEAFKRFHKNMVRFAIFGRPKAFVHRGEISAFIESFNVEIDQIAKSFSVLKHEDLENWETEFYQAKTDDEDEAGNQLDEIAHNPADVKTILGLGDDAAISFIESLKARQAQLTQGKYSSSTFSNSKGKAYYDNPPPRINFQPGFYPAIIDMMQNRLKERDEESNVEESAAAKAKREEAEWERIHYEARGGDREDEYEEGPPPPRWEPRRPPGFGTNAATATTGAGGNNPGQASTSNRSSMLPPPPPPPADETPSELPPAYF